MADDELFPKKALESFKSSLDAQEGDEAARKLNAQAYEDQRQGKNTGESQISGLAGPEEAKRQSMEKIRNLPQLLESGSAEGLKEFESNFRQLSADEQIKAVKAIEYRADEIMLKTPIGQEDAQVLVNLGRGIRQAYLASAIPEELMKHMREDARAALVGYESRHRSATSSYFSMGISAINAIQEIFSDKKKR